MLEKVQVLCEDAIDYYENGDYDLAEDRYKKAIKLNESLYNELSTQCSPEYRNDLACSWLNLGALQQQLGEIEHAECSYKISIELNDQLCKDLGVQCSSEYKNDLASAWLNLSVLQSEKGQIEKAEQSCTRSIELRSLLYKELDGQCPFEYKNSLANSWLNFGVIQSEMGNLKLVEKSYKKSIELRELFCEETDSKYLPEYKNGLAIAWSNMGDFQSDMGSAVLAEEYYRKSIELSDLLCNELKKQCPPEYKNTLASVWSHLGTLQSDEKKLQQAELSYNKALELSEALCEELGIHCLPEYKMNLASIWSNLGVLQNEKGHLQQAEISFKKAIDLVDLLCKELDMQCPPEYISDLANIWLNLGNLQGQMESFKCSESSYSKSIELTEQLCEQLGTQCPIEYKNDLSRAWLNLGILKNNTDTPHEAANNFKNAIKLHLELKEILKEGYIARYCSTYINAIHFFIEVTGTFPDDIEFDALLVELVGYLELHSSLTEIVLSLFSKLLEYHISNNELEKVLQVLNCIQGRELTHELAAMKVEDANSVELSAYLAARDKFTQAVSLLTFICDDEILQERKRELEVLQKELQTARINLAKLPEFKTLFTPFDVSITELQSGLKSYQARLIWIDLSDMRGDDSIKQTEDVVRGILAIPATGEAIWFDLKDFTLTEQLIHLSQLITASSSRLNCGVRFYSSSQYLDGNDILLYYRTHQEALHLSDELIEQASIQNNYCIESVLDIVWNNIKQSISDIWSANTFPLYNWLTKHAITQVSHLTQGRMHNVPLNLGAPVFINAHSILPSVALWRQRQETLMPVELSHYQIRSCMGVTQGDFIRGGYSKDRFIPYSHFESSLLYSVMKDAEGETSCEWQANVDDFNPEQHLFPTHKKPLRLVHLACHGGVHESGTTPQVKLSLYHKHQDGQEEISTLDIESLSKMPWNYSIELTYISSCIAGLTKDNSRGDPIGLFVPLMSRCHYAIGSLLPLNDQLAMLFSTIFYHYYLTKNIGIHQAFQKTQTDILNRDIPESVVNAIRLQFKPIIERLFDSVDNEALRRRELLVKLAKLQKDGEIIAACLMPFIGNKRLISKCYLEKEIYLSFSKLKGITDTSLELMVAGINFYGE